MLGVNAISSQESVAGLSRCVSRGGLKPAPCGQDHVLANLSASQGGGKALPIKDICGAALVACLAQFSDNPVHSQARIVGTATCDKSDKLTDIVEVTQVQPLDGAVTPVAVRIKQLRTLKAGWLDGAGKPPSDTSLDWLEQLLGQLPSDGSLPRPYLYPTPEGSVQAEWDIGPWSVTAEVDALNRRLAVSALNTQTQASHDYDIQAEHAEELVNFLKFLKTEPPSQLA